MQGPTAGVLALCRRSMVQIPRQDACAGGQAATPNVMQAFYRYAISAMWILWLLYWIAAARHAKPVRARENAVSRLSHMVPLALGVALFCT